MQSLRARTFAYPTVEQKGLTVMLTNDNNMCSFGAEAVKDLPEILSHSEFQKHVNVDADLKPVLEAPVTQMSFIYFAPDISVSERSAVGFRIKEVIDALVKTTSEATAAVCGWSIENDFPVLDGEEGEPEVGCACVIFVGWTSLHAARVSWEQAVVEHGEDLRKIQHAERALSMVTRHLQCRGFGQDNGGT